MNQYQMPKVMYWDDGPSTYAYFDEETICLNCGAPKHQPIECEYCMTNDMDIRIKYRES